MTDPRPEEDPLARLGRAVDAYLQHREGGGASDEEFLGEHEDLRDLLVPMVTDDETQSADPAHAGRLVPRYVGDFQVVREIGRGGMGVVYEAIETSLGRRVALKVLPAHLTLSPVQIERFRREATAAARLKHAAIAPIYSVGEHEGTHYFAMEFLDGGNLRDIAAEVRAGTREGFGVIDGANRTAEAASIVAQVAEALHYAHEEGVIHRDVKPHNILLTRDGTVRVVDFGLAKDLERESLTHTGEFAGTPHYVSPEQAAGKRHAVDRRSDVFSLGVVLYELLTGRLPFDGDSTHQILSAVSTNEPSPLRRLDARVPGDLETICLKALEKHPADRYPTAGAMAEDLRRFLRYEPIEATRRSPWNRAYRAARRRAGSILATTVGVVLAAAAGSLWWQSCEQTDLLAKQRTQAESAMRQLLTMLDAANFQNEPNMEEAYADQARVVAELYRKAIDDSDDDTLREEAARALGRAADSLTVLGHYDDAVTVSDEALAHVERLHATSPESLHYRCLLGRALQNHAATVIVAAPFDDRIALIERAIGYLEPLVDDPEWRAQASRGLAASLVARTEIQLTRGFGSLPTADMVSDMERAVALWDHVPSEEAFERCQSVGTLGLVLLRLGERERAEELVQEAIRESERWAEQRPDFRWPRMRVPAYERLLGDARSADPAACLVHYRRAVKLMRENAELFPYQSQDNLDLADSEFQVGNNLLRSGQGDAGEAMRYFEAAIERVRRIESDRAIARYRVADILARYASVLDKSGAEREPLEIAYEEAREAFVAALSTGVRIAHYDGSYGALMSNYAMRQLSWGDTDRAIDGARLAVEHQRRARDAHRTPRRDQWLRNHYTVLLDGLRRAGRETEIVGVAEQRLQDFSDSPRVHFDTISVLTRAMANREAEAARQLGERAVQVLARMIEKGMAKPAQFEGSPTLAPIAGFESYRQLVEAHR